MAEKNDEILKAEGDLAIAIWELGGAIRDTGVGIDRGNEFEADDFDELEPLFDRVIRCRSVLAVLEKKDGNINL